MLFHEIYGRYFRTVAAILRRAAEGGVTDADLRKIVAEEAFAESGMVIPDALRSGRWPLLDEKGGTVLSGSPQMPLTTLEKRWLKTLLSDPRIRLFDVTGEGLEDVEPLYDGGHIVWFDRYGDGDDFQDPVYRENFRTLLRAIRESRRVDITYLSYRKEQWNMSCRPCLLEYSGKDDKFRVRVLSARGPMVLNLSRILRCEPGQPFRQIRDLPLPENRELVLELTDRRNTLERVMLCFSYLKKETVRLEEDRYRVKLWYPPEDENEILIRVLSFGPTVQVLSPEGFLEKITARVHRQIKLRSP